MILNPFVDDADKACESAKSLKTENVMRCRARLGTYRGTAKFR
jgi:hypothetical protein